MGSQPSPREQSEDDALAAERRPMSWLAVEKEYELDGPEGRRACST